MIPRRLVTEAIATSLGTWTGRPVEVIRVATDVSKLDALVPYALLEPGGGGSFEYDYGNTWSDVTFVYTVTSVGRNYTQVEGMADKVRAGFLGAIENPITIAGYSIMARDPDTGPDEPRPFDNELWSLTEGFTVRVTTA